MVKTIGRLVVFSICPFLVTMFDYGLNVVVNFITFLSTAKVHI